MFHSRKLNNSTNKRGQNVRIDRFFRKNEKRAVFNEVVIRVYLDRKTAKKLRVLGAANDVRPEDELGQILQGCIDSTYETWVKKESSSKL